MSPSSNPFAAITFTLSRSLDCVTSTIFTGITPVRSKLNKLADTRMFTVWISFPSRKN